MERADAVSHALSKPGAWPDSPWGEDHDVIKVGSKIFLFPGAQDGQSSITVKNTAEAVDELKQRYPDFAGPAAYLDKRLWVRLVIEQVPDDEVIELIDDSYDLVVAKLKRSERP
jgi:predicted DNA-binding protein (MmcQ/YjbR family)